MGAVLTLNLADLTPRESKAIGAMLASLSGESVVVMKPVGTAADLPKLEIKAVEPAPAIPVQGVSIPETISDTNNADEDAAMDAIEAKTKKRGRPRKEVAVAQVDPQPAPAAEAETSTTFSDPASTPAVPAADGGAVPSADVVAPTFEEIKAAMERLKDKKGIQAAIDLLDDFKCARASEVAKLSDALRFDFVARCDV